MKTYRALTVGFNSNNETINDRLPYIKYETLAQIVGS